jgi:GT2 family glycosyltransferase
MIHCPPPLPGPERQARLDRYRFLLPLCRGKVVAEASPGIAEGRILLADTARSLLDREEAGTAEVLLWLAPLRGHDLAVALPTLRRRLIPGGTLAVAVSESADAARAALSCVFRHVAGFHQRPLAGTLIVEEALAQARVVALAGPAAGEAAPVTLLLASDATLPPLPGGVFEAAWPDSGTMPTATPAPRPVLTTPLADLPPPEPGLTELRQRAVSLVERLVEQDDRAIDLAAEAMRLRAQLDRYMGTSGGTAVFDVPRTAHPWPLAEAPDRDPAALTFYDHRPDDAVIAEGRAGDAFFRRHALLGGQPDIGGAVAELNAQPPHLRPPDDPAVPPDVSIIIPVHGQLAYTLNCLASLLAHRSRYSAEILVIDDCSPDTTAAALARVGGIVLHRNATNLGYLRTCNAAAEAARGRFIVLLNNDTRVLPGWLDALIGSFTELPRAGLIGSKLLYPDGTLQEAGAIIWRDASAWNYGRNDDPNRPHYTHAREVDYVSAASVAIPADVWRDLGGFDPVFAPAYCEDADFCLRLRRHGRAAWYQPASRVIHYEGRTSGTDTGSGIKAYQRVNAGKLFLRWREQLAAHRPNGEAPYFERERNVRRRALIVDATTPTPTQDAGSVTTMLTLRLFRDLGYKPHFTPQDNFLFEPAHTPALQAIGVECAYSPYEADFSSYIRRYGGLFDAVLVYRMPVLEQVLDELRRFAPQAPVLFHVMDLHSLRLQREAELAGTPAAHAAAARMKARELALIRRVDCTITHSTYERDLLARDAPEAPVVVWPFMFEFFGTTRGFADRRDFVFLGGYRHPPNVDAVQFFAADVLPLIRAREPEARFIIAGANPGPEVQALASEHVIVTGMIDDLREVFDAARVFVCPLRFGAGTKGKISTAMSYGLPVVSTGCGAEGMELQEGREVLTADDPAALAEACLRVYRDAALWRQMSEAGQALVREKHSPQMGRRILEAAIEAAWRHKLGVSA